MTAIVALKHEGKVYVGADSLATAGNMKLPLAANEKVFRLGKSVFGVCGAVRGLNLLRYELTMPDHDPRHSNQKYMVVAVAEAIRKLFKASGFNKRTDEVDRWYGGAIIAYKGDIFSLGGDYSVISPARPFHAEGSGEEYALGSLQRDEGDDPKERVLRALEAASHLSPTVGGPFHIEVLEA